MASQPTAAWQPPAGNPYAASHPVGGYATGSSDRQGRSAALYVVAGVIIALWGLFTTGFAVVRTVLIVVAISNIPAGAVIDYARLSGMIAGLLLSAVLGVIQLSGGIAMANRNNLRLAKSAAVIAAIPCFGCLVFPVGIWACVLLFSSQANRDFSD